MANFRGRQDKSSINSYKVMKTKKNGRVSGMPNQKPKRIRHKNSGHSQEQLPSLNEIDISWGYLGGIIIFGILCAIGLVVFL